MGKDKHVATLDKDALKKTVGEMKARGEAVDHEGREIYQQTGQLDRMVNVFGQTRVSHNAFVQEGTKFRLVRGPKLAFLSIVDGTGSMGINVEKTYYAMERIDGMLEPIRVRYQTDLSFAVSQDVLDEHPVFQMPQFESGNKFAEWMRRLIPDKNGHDPVEDYDLGLVYVRDRVETDIYQFYGLKGYLLLVADQIGRGMVFPEDVQRHLGYTLQASVSTQDICRKLLQSWHMFYINVGSGGYEPSQHVSQWWRDKLGSGRVITVPDADLLAEVQMGLVCVTETLEPNFDGFVDFLLAEGQNRRISRQEAHEVWNWLQPAEQHFGAQARLPGYNELPKPGDIFAALRDPWPIGHPRFSENPSQGGSPKPPTSMPTAQTRPGIDWSKF